MSEMIFRDDVRCFVRSLAYDFRLRSGTLILEDGSCTSMVGCIALFKKIDPNVEVILTVAGGRRDFAYGIIDGEWQARERIDG